MDTNQIVALLVAERDRLTKAIEALSGAVTAKRRGRPPKNPLALASAVLAPAAATPAATTTSKRKPRTAAQKKAQAERMKAYWANRKKSEK
jgi:hypothetical protein